MVAENGFETSNWLVGAHLLVRETGQRCCFSACRLVLLVAVSRAIGSARSPFRLRKYARYNGVLGEVEALGLSRPLTLDLVCDNRYFLVPDGIKLPDRLILDVEDGSLPSGAEQDKG